MTASFDLVDGQRKKATYTYNGLGHRVGQKISSLIRIPGKKIRYTIDMTRQYYNLLQKSEGGASCILLLGWKCSRNGIKWSRKILLTG